MTRFDFESYTDQVDYATYDPDDNKIRIYSGRVDQELYDELKRLGFGRAYKQGCFFQVWTPAREDAALALCGEITDEDSSLRDRAEERHGRFATYSSNAESRAEQAIKAGNDAVEGIPFGQPILVGHHSEKRHRAAVEKAQRAATKTVEEVDRRDYWQWRARGVLRHADRTFDRGVVMRRIKKLESAKRKKISEREGKDYNHALAWFLSDLTDEYPGEFQQKDVSAYHAQVIIATAWAMNKTLEDMPETEARLQKWQAGRDRWCNRWMGHLEGQIEYWKTILNDEHSEDIDEQYPLKKGCWIRCGYGWAQAVRVNGGADKRISSVSIDKETASWYSGSGWFYPRKVDYDKIKEWSETDPSSEEVLEAQLEQIGPPRKESEPDPLREQAEAAAAAAGQIEVRVNYNPDYFPTPIDVVDRMLNEVIPYLGDGRLFLDPSAGDGRILERALYRWPDVTTFWYEIDTAARATLVAKGFGGLERGADFLEAEPEALFDAVVMNPPFSRNQYKHHVKHAYEFVRPGGVLVALLPDAPFWNNEKDKFTKWLDDIGYKSMTLPRGTFEDTQVPTRIITVDKPPERFEQGRLL